MEVEYIDGDPTKGVRPIEHLKFESSPPEIWEEELLMFAAVPKDIKIPTSCKISDDIILEEK